MAALHYLMKPMNPEKLLTVLDRALEKRKQEERCLNLEAYGEMVRIPFYEIRWLDVHQNYVTVHAKAEYTVKRSLGDFEKGLDTRFCHTWACALKWNHQEHSRDCKCRGSRFADMGDNSMTRQRVT